MTVKCLLFQNQIVDEEFKDWPRQPRRTSIKMHREQPPSSTAHCQCSWTRHLWQPQRIELITKSCSTVCAASAAECTARRARLWRRQLGCPVSKPACGEAACMGPLWLHTPAMLTFLCSTLCKCLVQSLRDTFRGFPNFMQRLCLELASTRDQVRCSSNGVQTIQLS